MTDSMKTDIRALAIIPKTIAECMSLAEVLAKSQLLPVALRGKVPDVLMTILAGQEMGLAPMASLRNFHMIDGKAVMSADGMIALVMGSGKAQYFDRVEESPTSVTYETLRTGSKTPRRCTWTIDMAKAAALHLKDNWRGYPRAMLAARAKSELARDVYADVLAGCYTEDEIVEHVPREPHDAIDAEIVQETIEAPAELAAINAAETVEQLKTLAKTLGKLSGKQKEMAREAYQARLEALRAQEAGARSNGVVDKQPETAA